jgi:hypothetical protein
MEACPVCRKAVPITSRDGQEFTVSCGRCGQYLIRKMAKFRLDSSSSNNSRLSAWLRRNAIEGRPSPVLTQENLEEVTSGIPQLGISGRTRELLSAIATLAPTPGSTYSIDPSNDVSLAWANNAAELSFHVEALISDGLLKPIVRYMDGICVVSITPVGWQAIEEGKQALITRAFVAMSFSKEMHDVWLKGLKPGIAAAGYEAHRVDSDPHIGRIDLKILGDIRQSRFVVADATEQKQGVYYEAGFAEALGKSVIWTVRADEITKVHFDTRQFAHVLWETPQELAAKLEGVIVGVLGRGRST